MTQAKQLLLVDDERANLDLLEMCLKPLGHAVVKVTQGRDALTAFSASPPDLVLLDLVMPGFDGLDVLMHIRAHLEHSDTPVILLTAHSEREHRIRGLEAGADDFLEKPIDTAVLLPRVRTLLRLKEFRDALRASRDELVERNAALQRVQREQRELTEFIIHDLKGPLTTVAANAQWIHEQLGSEHILIQEAVGDVLKGASRLRAMISDLVTVSQLEHGTFPIRRAEVAVTSVLRAAIAEFKRPAALKHITLLEPPESCWSISADAELLQRVLENILDNSLRYTPELGRIAVSTEHNGHLEIAVANSGPPVPVSERKRIFEKFATSDQGARLGNAGLGLYFCKRAVEAHGGHIDVVETAEYPTCFRIRLPAH